MSNDSGQVDGTGVRGREKVAARRLSRVIFALVPPLCLVVATVWSFLPILGNDFVAWDDDKNFLANPWYRGLGWSNLAWAWKTFHLGVYQPLAWTLFGLEYLVFRLDPHGYHLTSLVLHAAVGVALYWLAVRLVRRARQDISLLSVRIACLLATALFVVHPLRVEVVAWVSCQGYLPCALFAILATMAYERSRPPGPFTNDGFYVTALAFFCSALLCHATALGLPFVLIALDFYPLSRFTTALDGRRAVLEKWPFLLVTALFCALGYLAKGSSLRPLQHQNLAMRLAQAGYGTVFYLLKTIWPYGLYAHHPMPSSITLAEPVFLLTFVVAIGVSLVALVMARQWPAFASGWFAYLAILAPNSGLVPFGHQLVADRYSYLSSIPLVVVLAGFLAGATRRHSRRLVAVFSALLICLGILTREQCRTWSDSTTLWRNVLAWDDSSSSAHNNLGSMLHGEGRYDEALHHYQLAAKHAPASAGPLLNCGVLLAERGQPAEAQDYLEQALRLDPSSAETRAWLAMVLSDQGRTRDALAQSTRAIRGHPNSASALFAHGMILAKARRLDESSVYLERARQLQPGIQPSRLSQALALSALGHLAEAEEILRNLVSWNPQSAEAHAGLGEVLARRGYRAEAVDHFRQALQIRPDHPAADQWKKQMSIR